MPPSAFLHGGECLLTHVLGDPAVLMTYSGSIFSGYGGASEQRTGSERIQSEVQNHFAARAPSKESNKVASL